MVDINSKQKGYRLHSKKVRRTIHPGLLFRVVRHRLGISRDEMGAIFGMSADNYRQRELMRVRYTLSEIIKLHDISGLSLEEFWLLMRELS